MPKESRAFFYFLQPQSVLSTKVYVVYLAMISVLFLRIGANFAFVSVNARKMFSCAAKFWWMRPDNFSCFFSCSEKNPCQSKMNKYFNPLVWLKWLSIKKFKLLRAISKMRQFHSPVFFHLKNSRYLFKTLINRFCWDKQMKH